MRLIILLSLIVLTLVIVSPVGFHEHQERLSGILAHGLDSSDRRLFCYILAARLVMQAADAACPARSPSPR